MHRRGGTDRWRRQPVVIRRREEDAPGPEVVGPGDNEEVVVVPRPHVDVAAGPVVVDEPHTTPTGPDTR